MKKTVSLLLLFALMLSALSILTGCAGKRYELVLVTDSKDVTDKGYNQSAWDEMTSFAIEKNLDCRYFIPQSYSYKDLVSQLRAVASDGASVIVTASAVFGSAVYTVQSEYPNIKFVLIDGVPHPENSSVTEIRANTASVVFSSEQSGFLAGYAAVLEGKTLLGFMGGVPNEDVCAYGYGFLQGAEYAAKQTEGTVSVTYHYTGDFEKSEKNKQTAIKMYEDGADVIFACGGKMEYSVIEAATEQRAYVICSDTDKRHEYSRVLTSAVKGVSPSLRTVLKSIYETNDFEQRYGGRSTRFNAENGGTGLSSFVINDKNGDAFDRFYKFERSDYEDILKKLTDNEITVKRSISISDVSGYAEAEELIAGLGLDTVNVSVVR